MVCNMHACMYSKNRSKNFRFPEISGIILTVVCFGFCLAHELHCRQNQLNAVTITRTHSGALHHLLIVGGKERRVAQPEPIEKQIYYSKKGAKMMIFLANSNMEWARIKALVYIFSFRRFTAMACCEFSADSKAINFLLLKNGTHFILKLAETT